MASGLAAAHDKGIAHRDLKPENVFITADDRVKIHVPGTAGYMAPEQVRGLAADHRADIFAFGAVLYEMHAGRRAFRGDTAMDLMMAIAIDGDRQLAVADAEAVMTRRSHPAAEVANRLPQLST